MREGAARLDAVHKRIEVLARRAEKVKELEELLARVGRDASRLEDADVTRLRELLTIAEKEPRAGEALIASARRLYDKAVTPSELWYGSGRNDRRSHGGHCCVVDRSHGTRLDSVCCRSSYLD